MTGDFVWRWRGTQFGPLPEALAARVGRRCRVLARGLKLHGYSSLLVRPAGARLARRGRSSSVLVEFEDGYQVLAMVGALRRPTEADWERWADEYAMRSMVAGPVADASGSISLPAVEWAR